MRLPFLGRKLPSSGLVWVCGNGHVVARAQRAGFFGDEARTVGIIGILPDGAFEGDVQNPPGWVYYAQPVHERCRECDQVFHPKNMPEYAINPNEWTVGDAALRQEAAA